MKHKNDVKEIVWLDIELVHPNEWNPFEQNDETFNNLVDNMREAGFQDPVLVAPDKEKSGTYKVVDGEHRWQAGRVLEYKQIPCIICEDWDEDQMKFQTMRFNMIKGNINPLKFGTMFKAMALKYGEEVTRKLMAIDRKEFEKLYKRTLENVPPEIRKQLQKSKKEIDNVQTLSSVLNNLFKKYGDTVKHGFMIFTYGGKPHTWIIMNETIKDKLEELKDACVDHDINLNVMFEIIFEEMSLATVIEKSKELTEIRKERARLETEQEEREVKDAEL